MGTKVLISTSIFGNDYATVPNFDDLEGKANKTTVENLEHRLDREIDIAKARADKAIQIARNIQEASISLETKLNNLELKTREELKELSHSLQDIIRKELSSKKFIDGYDEMVSKHLESVSIKNNEYNLYLASKYSDIQKTQQEIGELIESFKSFYEKKIENDLLVRTQFMEKFQKLNLFQRLIWLFWGKTPSNLIK